MSTQGRCKRNQEGNRIERATKDPILDVWGLRTRTRDQFEEECQSSSDRLTALEGSSRKGYYFTLSHYRFIRARLKHPFQQIWHVANRSNNKLSKRAQLTNYFAWKNNSN